MILTLSEMEKTEYKKYVDGRRSGVEFWLYRQEMTSRYLSRAIKGNVESQVYETGIWGKEPERIQFPRIWELLTYK